MKKIFLALIMSLVIFSLSVGAYAQIFDSPIPAEVIADRAFVRETHDAQARRVATLEEGDGLRLLEEWIGEDTHPWYRIEIDGDQGWIYGQVIRRLDGGSDNTRQAAQAEAPAVDTPAVNLQPGIVASDENYVTVVAVGQGTERNTALEQAWIESVRLAVGAVISSTSELNNDDFAETTIAHSRGVVESFDIIDERTEGSRVTVTIQAKVRKEILADAARIYSEAQMVRAETAGAIRVQLDIAAMDTTAEDMQTSGMALLKEVLESYSPEMFYTATLNPQIEFDRESRRPYVQITQKFNQELFWDEFVPRLHAALDGVAVRKEKKFYNDEVRQANQRLVREGFAEWLGTYSREIEFEDSRYNFEPNPIAPYSWYTDARVEDWFYPIGILPPLNPGWEYTAPLTIVVPENVSSYIVYYLPCDVKFSANYDDSWRTFETTNPDLYYMFNGYVHKMIANLVFSITYLDSGAREIHTQIIRMGARMLTIYRSFYFIPSGITEFLPGLRGYYPIQHIFSFSPGYVSGHKLNLFLGSGNFDLTPSGVRYFIELNESDLQKLDSMKFEYVFVN